MRIVSFALILYCLPFLGCAGSIKPTYPFPDLGNSGASGNPAELDRGITVYIDRFIDDRAVREIVIGDSESALGEGDAGLPISRALTKAFAGRGITSSDSAPLILSGAVKEWYARVTGGIGGGITAEARISVNLSNPADEQLYSALYSGSAEYSGGFSRKEFERVMVAAMQEAVAQVVADQKLILLIESY
jgi:hypothetical protein